MPIEVQVSLLSADTLSLSFSSSTSLAAFCPIEPEVGTALGPMMKWTHKPTG